MLDSQRGKSREILALVALVVPRIVYVYPYLVKVVRTLFSLSSNGLSVRLFALNLLSLDCILELLVFLLVLSS